MKVRILSIFRRRSRSEEIIYQKSSSRNGILHDLWWIHNYASMPRDSHLGDSKQAHLHNQAAGEFKLNSHPKVPKNKKKKSLVIKERCMFRKRYSFNKARFYINRSLIYTFLPAAFISQKPESEGSRNVQYSK